VSLSSPFVRRPVGTTLMTIALVIAGMISFRLLPVAPLPQVDFPTISVVAGLPGASPATMASAVATPLERQFGRIAGITEMTSVSFLAPPRSRSSSTWPATSTAPRGTSSRPSPPRPASCRRICRLCPRTGR